ncbi:MAG: hypothetical protein N3B14_01415 [Thermoleophilia bacterium]|nr:hypothetical protein [Thermoleophilia bacterium]
MTSKGVCRRHQSAEDLAILDVIADVVRRRGLRAWLVGGSVRDRALGREAPDLDVVVTGNARGVAQDLADRLRAPWFVLSDRHRAYRVVRPSGYIDVAQLRGKAIEEDLSLRDFTINAVAVSIPDEEIVDPFEGLRHIRERRLVAVSDRVFEDDALRLMRAARFVHVLGFALDPRLENLVRSQASLLTSAAPERVAAEMVLTLREGRSAAALALWRELGLLEQFLPESPATSQPGLAAQILVCLEDILAHPECWLPGQEALLKKRLDAPVDGAVERPVALRIAGALAGASAEEAARAAERLRFSRDLTSLLVCAARVLGNRSWLEHMTQDLRRPLSAPGRCATAFFWATRPWEVEILLLAAACEKAKTDEKAEQMGLPVIRWLLSVWAWRATQEVRSFPLDGTTLMRELGLSPGPVVGQVLREIRLAWEAGEIATPEQALEMAKTCVNKG